MRTMHTSKSQSRGKSYVSHAKNKRDMQREIDELKKELCRTQRRHSSPNSELSSEETDDATYRQRSRTPPSETFSSDEEYRHERSVESSCKVSFHAKHRGCESPSAISSTHLLPL